MDNQIEYYARSFEQYNPLSTIVLDDFHARVKRTIVPPGMLSIINADDVYQVNEQYLMSNGFSEAWRYYRDIATKTIGPESIVHFIDTRNDGEPYGEPYTEGMDKYNAGLDPYREEGRRIYWFKAAYEIDFEAIEEESKPLLPLLLNTETQGNSLPF